MATPLAPWTTGLRGFHPPLFVTGLQDQVPAAPPGPPSPAQATLHHQEAQHLLLDSGPPCSLGCPNKLLGKTRLLRYTCFLCTPCRTQKGAANLSFLLQERSSSPQVGPRPWNVQKGDAGMVRVPPPSSLLLAKFPGALSSEELSWVRACSQRVQFSFMLGSPLL